MISIWFFPTHVCLSRYTLSLICTPHPQNVSLGASEMILFSVVSNASFASVFFPNFSLIHCFVRGTAWRFQTQYLNPAMFLPMVCHSSWFCLHIPGHRITLLLNVEYTAHYKCMMCHWLSCGMLSPTKPHWGELAGPVIHLKSSTALWNLHHCLLKVQNKCPLVLSLILNIPVSQLLSGIPGISDITPANFCPQILYGMVQCGEHVLSQSTASTQSAMFNPSYV